MTTAIRTTWTAIACWPKSRRTRQTAPPITQQDLGPGDYFVAISGAGNLDFSPVIAGSGFDGATGSYELTIGSTDLGLSGDGPTVLSSDPAAGQVLDSSPLAIRLEMSGPLDPSTILPGQTVQLFSGTKGWLPMAPAVRSRSARSISRSRPTSSSSSLLAPLAPGNYVVWLAGDSSANPGRAGRARTGFLSARARRTRRAPISFSRSRSTVLTAWRARPARTTRCLARGTWAT